MVYFQIHTTLNFPWAQYSVQSPVVTTLERRTQEKPTLIRVNWPGSHFHLVPTLQRWNVAHGLFPNFISRACPPDSSRGDSKEKANRGLTQPYAGLAGHSPPPQAAGFPGFFPWIAPRQLHLFEVIHPYARL